ncbi:Aste57867_21944 [Aphanomyces stellatus]|uniref:Aste57867_21944 protein n=1 Tax=Aphanomyces stellatus TaxID=120398 RepID=A0A485LK77_9STRA|nr:hypothetical protein As57867_021875 [Aphanomyces stellatus]VFT98612.1 Aste57867_21944 [Aphanomyces stellatus]
MQTLTALALAASMALMAHACTIVVVTKEASADNTPLTTHTDDTGGGAVDLRVVRVPAMDHAPGAKRAVFDFVSGYPRLTTHERGNDYRPKEGEDLMTPLGYIPQVPHTYAYWDQDYAMMNEKQLAIAESTASAKSAGWPLNLPYGHNLFHIGELSKLALERCDNARCAIQTMGDAAVQYGFYSVDSGSPDAPSYGDTAEALAVSDKFGETWIFHVLTGPQNASAVWVAQRVPPGHVSVVANGFVIRQMNLTDTDNFLASDNVLSFARDMGWWHESQGIPFDFTDVYNYDLPGPVAPLYTGRRVWRVLDWFAPSLKLDSTVGEANIPTYPFSVPVDTLVTVESVMELMKDHYEGTSYDQTKGLAAGPFGNPNRFDGPEYGVTGGWERPICMFRTLYSFVLQSNGALPDHVGGTIWYGQSVPHGTVYVPFSCGQETLPKSYVLGKQSEFHPESSWWYVAKMIFSRPTGGRVFDFVNNWSMLRFNVINAEVRDVAKTWQHRAFAAQARLREKGLTVSVVDVEAANNGFADQVFHAWWSLAWHLVSKYSDSYITTGEAPTEMNMPGYSKEWLLATDFATWPSNSYHAPLRAAAVVTNDAATTSLATSAATGYPGHHPLASLLYVGIGISIGVIGVLWIQKAHRRMGYHSLS